MAITRRSLLSSVGGVAVAGTTVAGPAFAGQTGGLGAAPVVRPDDPRYADLMLRGQNRRFAATPDYVQVVTSTEQVVGAVQRAVRSGKRIAVRAGGHCFEDFVDHPEVEVVIDLSRLTEVFYDPRHRAISIGAGSTLEHVYRELYYRWGVTVPGGGCLGVGVGGHFSGGGYGPLSRLHGSVVDHLYGVEIVVVDSAGRARAVTATREGPHRDLWWAHTGGGGGNFGVVTRYLMRSAGVSGSDPTRALPRPPKTLLSGLVAWNWNTITEAGFARTLRNFFSFYQRHSAADSAYASLYSPLLIPTRTEAADSGFLLSTQIDAGIPDARGKLAAFHAAITDGVDPKPYVSDPVEGPFLTTTFVRSIQESGGDATRAKWKAGYLRKAYDDGQIATLYRRLTAEGGDGIVLLVPYGGKVNTVPPHATATAQRDSFMKMVASTQWTDASQDEKQIDWIRRLYRDLYAGTGGVPVPNERNDGSYINYPDNDLTDPDWNTSGVPWHDLYYKDNYPRLQRIKAIWDPGNVFRHALSIRP